MTVTNMLALQLIYWAAVFACCVHALRFGGRPEHVGAGVIFVGSVLSVAAASQYDSRFTAAEGGILAVDVVAWLVLLKIALSSNRYWPIWAAAFHSIAVITHAAVLIDSTVVPWAYAVGQGLWAYPMLAALLAGAERCRRMGTRDQRRASQC